MFQVFLLGREAAAVEVINIMSELPTEAEREALSAKMDEYERLAWHHLGHYRFFQAFAAMEAWALLHRLSGQKRANPFQEIAGLARRKHRDAISRERS